MEIKSYQDFVRREGKGEFLMDVEPVVARKLFTDMDHSVIKEKINESLFTERFLVKTCWFLEFICLFAAIILSIFALKWYSIIAIPLMVVVFAVLSGEASMGKQSMGDAVFLVAVCFSLAYYLSDRGMAMIVWLIILPLPYLFIRSTYKLATMFLRLLSVRNEKAFNLIYGRRIGLEEE